MITNFVLGFVAADCYGEWLPWFVTYHRRRQMIKSGEHQVYKPTSFLRFFFCFRATNRRFFGGRAFIFQWFRWWWWCRMINDIIFSWCFVVRGDWLACVCFYSFVYAIVFQNWGLPKGVLGGELDWSVCLWFTTLHTVEFQKRELPQEGLIRELKGMMIGLFGFGYATSVFSIYHVLQTYILYMLGCIFYWKLVHNA
jgi:hypothetical protein